MAGPRKYPDELRDRAVRLVFESKRTIAHVARTWASAKELLRNWVGRPRLTAVAVVIC